MWLRITANISSVYPLSTYLKHPCLACTILGPQRFQRYFVLFVTIRDFLKMVIPLYVSLLFCFCY